MAELWKEGWQEGSFERLQPYLHASPALFQGVSPSDVVEDAYLLNVASTLLLRDEDSGAKAVHAGTSRQVERPSAGPPPGAPPFVYERCATPGADASAAFAAAKEGRFGSFHREAARSAGSVEAWGQALSALRRGSALRASWPEETPAYDPPLSTFGEDFKACTDAVLRKAVHAFKIGFGLWGRWESP